MSKDGTVRVHLSISLAFLLVDSLSLSIILSFSFSISPILSVPISNHIFQWSHLFLYFTFISYFVFVFDFHSLYPQVVIFLYNCPSYYASLFLLFSGCLYLKFLVSLFTFYFLFYFFLYVSANWSFIFPPLSTILFVFVSVPMLSSSMSSRQTCAKSHYCFSALSCVTDITQKLKLLLQMITQPAKTYQVLLTGTVSVINPQKLLVLPSNRDSELVLGKGHLAIWKNSRSSCNYSCICSPRISSYLNMKPDHIHWTNQPMPSFEQKDYVAVFSTLNVPRQVHNLLKIRAQSIFHFVPTYCQFPEV